MTVAEPLPVPKVPVTVLTGFLGAGKTTLLNRILTEHHGKRIAVIENEFGEIGIDNELVIDSEEEIFEMNNGCICCTVRGDLIRILGNLLRRRDAFDHILIETTGLADPAPVIQTFFVDDEVAGGLDLDGVVTVVDAKHVLLHLGDSPEVEEQIAFADVIVLNKVDLVSAGELDRLEARIRRVNRVAAIHRAERAGVAVDSVVGLGAFDLDRALAIDPQLLADDAHEHDEEVGSVGFETPGDLDPERLNAWLGNLLATQGQDIFRMKGILALAGAEERSVFQGVHMLFDGQPDRPWRPDETRGNQLVFIGRNLDRAAHEGLRGVPRLSGAQASLAPRFTAELPDYVHAVAFSPGREEVAACAADGGVVAFAADGWGEPRELASHPGGATCLAWSPRGVVASGGVDGIVRLDGAPVALGPGWVEALAWRPDGGLLAVAHRRRVHFLSPEGAVLDVSEALPATVACLGWHPRGVEVAAGSYGGVRLLRGNGAQVARRLEWKGSVLALAVSPDGRRLAHGNQDASVHFWDLKRRSELEMHGYATKVREPAWSGNGRWLATGGGDTITVWDFARPGGRRDRARSSSPVTGRT